MSALNLSHQLIRELQEVIARHDAEAREDAAVGLQYLAAVIGFVAAQYPGSRAEKEELLEHLHGLARHVLDERHRPPVAGSAQAPAAPPAPGHIEPSADDPAIGSAGGEARAGMTAAAGRRVDK